MTRNSKENQISFNKKEIIALYKIVKEHQENIPKTEEEIHFDYYDNYEQITDNKTLSIILRRISNSLPQKEREEINKDSLRKKYSSFNNYLDEKVYTKIESAFENLRTVEITYFNMESAEFSKRKIDVYYKSRRYIIGYCHLRKAIRKFRTGRIASARLTEGKYKIPENFDRKKY